MYYNKNDTEYLIFNKVESEAVKSLLKHFYIRYKIINVDETSKNVFYYVQLAPIVDDKNQEELQYLINLIRKIYILNIMFLILKMFVKI